MLITELFEPKSLSDLDPNLNVEVISKGSSWAWQFEVPNAQGEPTPFCLRAGDLRQAYYMSDEFKNFWFINMIQAKCSTPLKIDNETLSKMSDVGNMGRESVTVFSTVGSLLNDFIKQTQAKGVVFNSVPGREKLYSTFAAVIKRQTGWEYASHQHQGRS
jgi:hypothetical protein